MQINEPNNSNYQQKILNWLAERTITNWIINAILSDLIVKVIYYIITFMGLTTLLKTILVNFINVSLANFLQQYYHSSIITFLVIMVIILVIRSRLLSKKIMTQENQTQILTHQTQILTHQIQILTQKNENQTQILNDFLADSLALVNEVSNYRRETFASLGKLIRSAEKEIIIVVDEAHRFFAIRLIVSIIHAFTKNEKMTISVYYLTTDKSELNQDIEKMSNNIRLLYNLGCNIYLVDKNKDNIPILPSLVLINSEDSINQKMVLSCSLSDNGVKPWSKSVSIDKKRHKYLIRAYLQLIKTLHEQSTLFRTSEPHKIEIISCDENNVIEKLRKIEQYQEDKVKISYQQLFVKNLKPQNIAIFPYKSDQIEILENFYDKKQTRHTEKFKALKLHLRNGKEHLIVPPIIEKQNNEYWIVEGHTRCSYIIEKSKEKNPKIWCIVIEGAANDLPERADWNTVKANVFQKDEFDDHPKNPDKPRWFRDIEFIIHEESTKILPHNENKSVVTPNSTSS